MITEWFLALGSGMGQWFASLFPTWDPPEFLATADDTINDIYANVDGLGVWANWVYIVAVVGAVVAVWLIGLTVKGARAIAAHIPFFGGAG